MRSIVSLLALALLSCGFSAESVELASSGSPLRLSRVVMYQNGLAHFERRGRAGSSAIELRVPAAQVDDVLRTLTVVDGGDAAITGVRLLASEPGQDATLRIGLASEGARDLRITYVTEAPGWRPTYRVVVSDDGQVHLQGLAVVDNPTSETWRDVALTLSTDVPLSFRYDLRQGQGAERPHFGADGRLVQALTPPAIVNPLGQSGLSDVNVAYGMAQRGQPEVSNRAGRVVGENRGQPEPAAPSGAARIANINTSANASTNALLAFEERPEAEGSDFRSVEGFDLGGHESGMVPFVDTRTAGELALVFKPAPGGALSQAHPYRAVLFRNPTESSLSTGPVAIYAGERFVGDGVTAAIPARAHAFVPFAIERSISVRQSTERAEDEVRATALAGGVLTVELRAVHRSLFA
ncbi:MAG: DUF4139 domain-containing protein, partial [Sandaracinaceae bacterium]|nr:DUF4139 domain-containing protein [Sandaracinaceae bacterium]